jgi:hypothetical protein
LLNGFAAIGGPKSVRDATMESVLSLAKSGVRFAINGGG